MARFRFRLIGLALAGGAAAAAVPGGEARFPDRQGRLVLFDKSYDPAKGSDPRQSRARVADGALEVTTLQGQAWPGHMIRPPAGTWDLSKFQFLSLDLENVSDRDFDIYIRVDAQGPDGKTVDFGSRVGVQPGQRTTLTAPIPRAANPAIQLHGMIGRPAGLDAKGFNPARTTGLVVFTAHNDADRTFRVSNVRAFGAYREPKWAKMAPAQFFPFIDEYGQFVHGDWPGKVKGDADLAKAREAEERALAAAAPPKGWNQYGGYADGPQREATGHFRTEKVDGKWWLVDPEGRLFFSVGLCGVGYGGAQTSLVGRDGWFRNLPAADDPAFGGFRHRDGAVKGGEFDGRPKESYDFSAANLRRKYGGDWKKQQPERVARRLRAWGVNTLGNWSHEDFWRVGKTPYTLTFWHNSRTLRNANTHFPDPYDPKFPERLEGGLRAPWVQGSHDDPWCVGYFVDNEMPWGGTATLAEYTLDSPADQPAKRRFLDFLTARHGDLAALNRAWGADFADADAFLRRTRFRPATDAGRADLEAFTTETADAYFGAVRAAIKKVAPRKLYLGCRSVGGAANLAAAAGRHCDVVSYNMYCASVRDVRMPGDVDAPMMIGEFHFAGLDRGPFWSGLFAAADQRDRAAKLRAYVESALDNPYMVGVHWFQYADQAATGRGGDGENGQVGFVDVTDAPYAETVDAMRRTADAMYARRLKR